MTITTQLIQSDIKMMSSREIAGLTGKRHPDVKRDIINMLHDLIEDVSSFAHTYKDSMKRDQTEYLLDRDHTDCLLTGYSAKARMLIIKRWKELEAGQVPQTYAAALIEAGRLAQITQDQAEQLAIAAPKVEFHDTVVNSTNTFSTRDAAKKINQRPIKFGWWLKDKGYLCLNGRAAQKYIDQGLFVTHTGVSDSEHAYTQTRITGKGCAYFANKLFEIKL